jgi:hypothetical protein
MSWAARAGSLVAALLLAGCAGQRAAGPPAVTDPAALQRSLLGANEGLSGLRAVVDARLSFAGKQVTFPGVLLLQRSGGFRLDLLDPLDRPVLILFPEGRDLVQYRPSLQEAASLGPFTRACGGMDPAAWVATVLAGSPAPVDGEEVGARTFLGSRYLERRWKGELRQSVKYSVEGGEPRPTLVSWYCGDEAVLQLRFKRWRQDPAWRIPERFEITYVQAGLTVGFELTETEPNYPQAGGAMVPRLGPETRWSVWDLSR